MQPRSDDRQHLTQLPNARVTGAVMQRHHLASLVGSVPAASGVASVVVQLGQCVQLVGKFRRPVAVDTTRDARALLQRRHSFREATCTRESDATVSVDAPRDARALLQ